MPIQLTTSAKCLSEAAPQIKAVFVIGLICFLALAFDAYVSLLDYIFKATDQGPIQEDSIFTSLPEP